MGFQARPDVPDGLGSPSYFSVDLHRLLNFGAMQSLDNFDTMPGVEFACL